MNVDADTMSVCQFCGRSTTEQHFGVVFCDDTVACWQRWASNLNIPKNEQLIDYLLRVSFYNSETELVK